MDILAMLTEQSDELLPCDLAMLRDELLCGSYPPEYVKACIDSMDDLMQRFAQQSRRPASARQSPEPSSEAGAAPKVPVYNGVFVVPGYLSPCEDGSTQAEGQGLASKKTFAEVLAEIRMSENYKEEFKSFISQPAQCCEEFVERNFALFTRWELSAILSCVSFDEAFLERHYDSLDKKALAASQLFSEEFFIKHFSDLDAATVLRKGKNPWRAKEARSSKLDVFLRIKGVRL